MHKAVFRPKRDRLRLERETFPEPKPRLQRQGEFPMRIGKDGNVRPAPYVNPFSVKSRPAHSYDPVSTGVYVKAKTYKRFGNR